MARWLLAALRDPRSCAVRNSPCIRIAASGAQRQSGGGCGQWAMAEGNSHRDSEADSQRGRSKCSNFHSRLTLPLVTLMQPDHK